MSEVIDEEPRMNYEPRPEGVALWHDSPPQRAPKSPPMQPSTLADPEPAAEDSSGGGVQGSTSPHSTITRADPEPAAMDLSGSGV
eukprot:4905959-Karenia_brevis.AAC.1